MLSTILSVSPRRCGRIWHVFHGSPYSFESAGGLFNFTHGNQRIQCIWKTDQGGNHHDHVHVGVRPA